VSVEFNEPLAVLHFTACLFIFSLSQTDHFVSHDWASGRWQKTAMRLLIYNGNAAMQASMLTGALLSPAN